jgi:hypothetical protein
MVALLSVGGEASVGDRPGYAARVATDIALSRDSPSELGITRRAA